MHLALDSQHLDSSENARRQTLERDCRDVRSAAVSRWRKALVRPYMTRSSH